MAGNIYAPYVPLAVSRMITLVAFIKDLYPYIWLPDATYEKRIEFLNEEYPSAAADWFLRGEHYDRHVG